jgi:ElaB/YqjD/DUF883 family membrane-anchored ribosome-binding protein
MTRAAPPPSAPPANGVGVARKRMSVRADTALSDESHAGMSAFLVAGRARFRQSPHGPLPNLGEVGARGCAARAPHDSGRDNESDTREPKPKENAMRSSSPSNPVARDIQNVVSDAQDLLKTVQDQGGDKIGEMRAKMQTQIDAARQTLNELQHNVQDGAKMAMDTTDEYVRSNPWRAVGISAGIGALIGFLIARR